MLFCPSCANTLLIDGESGVSRFFCPTCPYIFPISSTHVSRQVLQRKEVDDVLGGEKAWENVDSIEQQCPRCEHRRAYYMMIQTRSADEPSTIFYKCCNHSCSHQWREK